MSLFPIFLTVLVLLLAADFLRWKVLVGRELKRHDLVGVRALTAFITPAKGHRLVEACTCERNGKEYRVVITNRGWLRTQLSIEIVEI
jgi:hypothetical protein